MFRVKGDPLEFTRFDQTAGGQVASPQNGVFVGDGEDAPGARELFDQTSVGGGGCQEAGSGVTAQRDSGRETTQHGGHACGHHGGDRQREEQFDHGEAAWAHSSFSWVGIHREMACRIRPSAFIISMVTSQPGTGSPPRRD